MSSGSLDACPGLLNCAKITCLVVYVEIYPRDHMDSIRVVDSQSGPFCFFRQLWWDSEGN